MKAILLFAIAATVSLSACDEGRIHDSVAIEGQQGISATLTATLTGTSSWTDGYSVVIAGFADGNDYALISKPVSATGSDGPCSVDLTGIPATATTIELCAVDRLRRRVATFASVSTASSNGTILLQAGEADVSMAGAIQRDIFNTTCIQCHGRNGHSAASLNLTDGQSFRQMVSVPSVKVDGAVRVMPGDSGASLLYRILSSDESATWNYDHSVEVPRQEKLELIRNWIDGGARH